MTLVAAAAFALAANTAAPAMDGAKLALNPGSITVNHTAFGASLPMHLASLRTSQDRVVQQQQQQQQQTARQPEGASGQMVASRDFADTGFAV